MSHSLLVEFFKEIPENRGNRPKLTRKESIELFKRRVAARYTQGTLLRLLHSADGRDRRAALIALGLLGNPDACASVATLLHDEDREIAQAAADSLWSLWFRGDTPAHTRELQRLVRLRDPQKLLTGLDALLHKAPDFAEAYNQRAIVHFRLSQLDRSIADCEKTLELNPLHFGAQAGLGQCFLQMRKHRSALRAFRNALRINPRMDGVAQTIRALESALGEEERRDDKK